MQHVADLASWLLLQGNVQNPVMQSVANKAMDSRKAHYGVMQSNKH